MDYILGTQSVFFKVFVNWLFSSFITILIEQFQLNSLVVEKFKWYYYFLDLENQTMFYTTACQYTAV